MVYIDKPDDTIKKIVGATFPEYKGRKFKISSNIPKRLDSYWSGGSRDYYAFYELSTDKAFLIASNHPAFEKYNQRDLDELPPGIVLVNHRISCGRDVGITIFANPVDITPLLPSHTEVTDNEKIVLRYTVWLKPSYNGIKNYRFYEANRITGISLSDWEIAKQSLIEKKLLNKAGAITAAGRNVSK